MAGGARASIPSAAARLLYQGPEQYLLGFADVSAQGDAPVQQIFSGKPKKLQLG
jgi:hypothetical protein